MNKIKNITDGVVVTSRVRLARNLATFPFPHKLRDPKSCDMIVKQVYSVVGKIGDFRTYRVDSMTVSELEALKEKHLISKDLQKRKIGAALISSDEAVSIMINEEDHIRAQCMQKGFNLGASYQVIDHIDDLISEKLTIAFDKDLGYLTSCPTNIGTGMRASVMLFLPGLTIHGTITSIINALAKLGLTVRGVYGEGSAAHGFMYQVSNQVSFGISEKDILRNVEDAVMRICEAEKSARRILMEKNNLDIKDRVNRAYGILTNCSKLATNEFMTLISEVKLGAYLGLLKIKDVDQIDDIIAKGQPASIMLASGQELSALQRDEYRANYVAKALLMLTGK